MMARLYTFLKNWTANYRFVWFVVGLFILEALWFVFSARYPMASDEDFHVGIINIYSHQFSPFFAAQPAGADAFGAIVRDASYLQHYIMSFPLRLFRGIGLSDAGQIIGLRLFSVGFAAGALVVFRKLLARTSLSPRLANFVLLIFVLVPIFPFVAAQVNYDNLFLLLTAYCLLVATRLSDSIRQQRSMPAPALTVLISLGLLNCLVKFAFLPILFGIAVYLFLVIVRNNPKTIFKATWHDFIRRSRWLKIGLVLAVLVSLGLFAERYAYNAAKYQTLTPECDTVLSIDQCQQYGPWVRNYKFKTIYYENRQRWSFTKFSQEWFDSYRFSLQFALNGPFSNYTVAPPLPAMQKVFEYGLYAAIIPLLWCSWKLFKTDKTMRFLIGIALLYTAVLFIQNYADFKATGQAVAQQGRYLLPVLIILFAWTARCIQMFFASTPRPIAYVRYVLAALVLFGMLQGGGATTFIVRSDDNWYWQNSTVSYINWATRQALKPLFIGV